MSRNLRHFVIGVLVTLNSGIVLAQYAHTVLPIGNVADIRAVTPFAHAVREMLDSIGGNQSVLFTGDFSDAKRSVDESLARVDTIIALLGPSEQRKLIFIPGERDWANSGPEGWQQVLLLEEHIRGLDNQYVDWPLHHGCPGPEEIDLDLTLQLIVVNTQWWNHPYGKPTPESAACDIATDDEAMEEIEKIISETKFGNLIIAGHFPVISGGQYGGHFPFTKWVLPVPVVSTMLTSFRQNIGQPVDIVNERYSVFREEMEDILSEYPSLVYVSGHEPARAVQNFEENILVQSGIPTREGYISSSSNALYKSASPGLLVIQYDQDGNAWTSMYDWKDQRYHYADQKIIFQAPCKTPIRDVSVNQRLVPCLDDRYVLPKMTGEYPPSTTVHAGLQYRARGFQKMILGEHYREAWTTAVTVPYLDIDTVDNGLIPYLKGGGRQTKSLRMHGEDGREYAFRSVDKDPSKSLSYSLRQTVISLAVRDQTTTEEPYGAMVASRLLDHTDILHASPRLFVMPNDEKLGPFRNDFGNVLGMLEERPSGSKTVEKIFADAHDIYGSSELFHELYQDRDNHIDAQQYVQARVFDMWVGDWGKHEDNWKWAGYKAQGGTYFRPIPRDRDHVFSRWDGFLPWLADREWAKPAGENFGETIHGIRSLMWQARHMDRLLANQMTRQDWVDAAHYLQAQFTPEGIDSAMLGLPVEIRPIDGPGIAEKLKTRLKDLDTYADTYYRMLAKSVDVCGSNKNEHFDILRNTDGTLDVSVYKNRDKQESSPLYQRRFYPDETDEVRVYGLQGDDSFSIHGNADKSILVRVVPGSGQNVVVDSSDVKKGRPATRVYGLNSDTGVSDGKETKEVHIPYQEAYQYRRTAFTYNTYLPNMYLSYSSGNGVTLGGGVLFTRQAYDKPDFSATHKLHASVSSLGNFRFDYAGKLRYVLGKWDFAYGCFIDKHQRLNYFFGTGNNTTINKDILRSDYYTLRYSSLQFYGGLSRTFWKRSSMEGIITVMGSGKENIENNIFEPDTYPDVAGHGRLRILKAHLACDLDFRDRTSLPRHGMRFTCIGTAGRGLNDDGIKYGNVEGTLEHFVTVGLFTLGVKIGGAIQDGKTPFYDLFYLGQNTFLRGYRKNRFTGESLAFLNSDLRIQVLDHPRSLIPFKLGLIFFYDSGKIFDRPPAPDDPGWHMGYGAGFYIVPLKERFALQLTAGFSKEESAGLIRFGIGQSF